MFEIRIAKLTFFIMVCPAYLKTKTKIKGRNTTVYICGFIFKVCSVYTAMNKIANVKIE